MIGFGTNGRDPVIAVIVKSGNNLSNPIIKFSITLNQKLLFSIQ